MKKTYLAKSSGVCLYDHMKDVSKTAEYIAKKSIDVSCDNLHELSVITKITGLLHDIGKATVKFQEKLQGLINKTGYSFIHNEIGWAFLHIYLKHKHKDIITNVVLYHHGINHNINSNLTAYEILAELKKKDIENMKDILVTMLGKGALETNQDTINKNSIDYVMPSFYVYDKSIDITKLVDFNEKITFIRGCVISADKLVSEFESSTKNYDTEVQKLINKNKQYTITTSPYSDITRFELQKKITEEAKKTTIVKAPAGFGKTLTGLIWASKLDKKLIWVCPRNMVAQSVYQDILTELENCNIKGVSVELYLTGETQERNHTSKRDFTSDIIVTNIDSFLAPSVDDKNNGRLFFINNVNVIFDEYHELLGNSVLFSSFITLMRVRNCITTSKTLLLSATTTNMEYLWSGIQNPTTILPSKNKHYPAAHNQPYYLEVNNKLDETKIKDGDLLLFNSIKEAQRYKVKTPNAFLIHSNFEEDDSKKLFETLLDVYGKKSIRDVNKPLLIGTPIVQASLNISTKNIFDSLLSPETFLQRVGRCNRFGDFDGVSNITLTQMYYSNQSEKSVVKTLYDDKLKLSDLWFKSISLLNEKTVTLNDLYDVYNQFYIDNEQSMKNFINNSFRTSLEGLSRIYPKRYLTQNEDVEYFKAGGNKLRSSGNELFIIAEKTNGGWSNAFNINLYSNKESDFSEGCETYKLSEYVITKELINDKRFSYNELFKKYNNKNNSWYKKIKGLGDYSDRPYIRHDIMYDNILGFVDKKIINKNLI
jgi:CRISPR-associated endonuclease Cas3-HD